MLGIDFHVGFPTPESVLVVGAIVRFGVWSRAEEKECVSVEMPPGSAISKVFDIGRWIVHDPIDPDILCVLDMMISGSSGHFGVSSVRTPKGPIAVALMFDVNPQLNCGTPLSLPTGAVLASNSVIAGMTLGDVIAGLVSMSLTILVEYALGEVFGNLAKELESALMEEVLRMLPIEESIVVSKIGSLIVELFPAVKHIGESVGDVIFDPVKNIITEKFYDQPIENFSNKMGKQVDHGIGTSEYFDNSGLLPPFPIYSTPEPLVIFL